MRVKVGPFLFDASDVPIAVILEDGDRENICSMPEDSDRYSAFPDAYFKTEEAARKWLTTDVQPAEGSIFAVEHHPDGPTGYHYESEAQMTHEVAAGMEPQELAKLRDWTARYFWLWAEEECGRVHKSAGTSYQEWLDVLYDLLPAFGLKESDLLASGHNKAAPVAQRYQRDYTPARCLNDYAFGFPIPDGIDVPGRGPSATPGKTKGE